MSISVLLAAYCDKDHCDFISHKGDASFLEGGTDTGTALEFVPFFAEQMASILPQLNEHDELLVSDDSPEGCTAVKKAVGAFDDPRIRYIEGPGLGVIKNVEFLLGEARGEILVLSDQDDVWLPGKLARVREHLPLGEPAVLLHDAKMTDAKLCVTEESLFAQRGVGRGVLRNLMKNGYTGCCMAMTKELLPYILPFPEGIPMHDQWIGLQGERRARVILLREALILHRRHAGTQTGQAAAGVLQKVKWRWGMAKALLRRR